MKLSLVAAVMSMGIAATLAAPAAQASFYLDAVEVRDNPSGGRTPRYFGFTRLLLEKNQDLVGHEAVVWLPGVVNSFDAIELKDQDTPMGVLLKGPDDTLMYYDRLVGSRVLHIMGFDSALGRAADTVFVDPPWARRFIIGNEVFDDTPPPHHPRAPLAEFISGPPPTPTVPEPASLSFFAGLAALAFARRKSAAD
ncbi:MAG: hypothetical protein NTW19_08955 [Planctomycetota bacterium]|nr:hypothetical protein [Planctomycetota bacterium]